MTIEIEICNGDESWPQVEPLFAEVWTDIHRHAHWREIKWANASLRVLLEAPPEGLICHVGLYFRMVEWQGRRMHIGGIGGVSTKPAFRRRGYAGVALAAAIQTMRDRGDLQFLLLFCEPHNESFYAARGWHRFAGDVFVTQPEGRVPFTAMAPFVFDMKRTVRSGTIDLCGLPW